MRERDSERERERTHAVTVEHARTIIMLHLPTAVKVAYSPLLLNPDPFV